MIRGKAAATAVAAPRKVTKEETAMVATAERAAATATVKRISGGCVAKRSVLYVFSCLCLYSDWDDGLMRKHIVWKRKF